MRSWESNPWPLTMLLSRIWLPLTTLQLHITHGLQLPSFTALRHTHIHHCTNYTAVTNLPWLSCHTCTSFTHPHISSTLPYTRCEVLFCTGWHSERFPCFHLDCLFTLTICCLPLDILSVCHLPRPLHCPCCWFCLAFITPVTTFDHCLSDHLLSINKAAIGSNYTASSLQL